MQGLLHILNLFWQPNGVNSIYSDSASQFPGCMLEA